MDSQEHESKEITPEEIELRKAWLGFDASDEEVIVNTVDRLIFFRVEGLMDTVYKHFVSFEETRVFFPDEAVLQRAKAAQTQYFRRLTKGNYDAEYVRERIKVGSTHRRIGLAPKWYLGAYFQAFAVLVPVLIKQYAGEPERLEKAVLSFLKLIFFDMALALDGYLEAKQS